MYIHLSPAIKYALSKDIELTHSGECGLLYKA